MDNRRYQTNRDSRDSYNRGSSVPYSNQPRPYPKPGTKWIQLDQEDFKSLVKDTVSILGEATKGMVNELITPVVEQLAFIVYDDLKKALISKKINDTKSENQNKKVDEDHHENENDGQQETEDTSHEEQEELSEEEKDLSDTELNS